MGGSLADCSAKRGPFSQDDRQSNYLSNLGSHPAYLVLLVLLVVFESCCIVTLQSFRKVVKNLMTLGREFLDF